MEDCLVESRLSSRSKSPLTLFLSLLTHGGILGALILIPLFSNQVLPLVALVQPPAPPTAPRAIELVPTRSEPTAARPASAQPTLPALVEPLRIPTQIARVDDLEPAVSGYLPTATSGGITGFSGIFGGSPGMPQGFSPFGGPSAAPPPPPPTPPQPPPPAPEPPAVPAAPVRTGGDVLLSKLIHQVTPVYPTLARAARAQGAVQLEAVVTRDGTIDPARLRVISGHPLLVAAAVEAVRQWRYRPTELNGVPIEIVSTITVNFSFN